LTELKELGVDALNVLGYLELKECPNIARKAIADYTHKAPESLDCVRVVWRKSDHQDKKQSDILDMLNSTRRCACFFPYNSGYSPIEHKELQRDAQSRKLLLVGMLLSAVIGAAAAIFGGLLAR
jgi:hypothetical protein